MISFTGGCVSCCTDWWCRLRLAGEGQERFTRAKTLGADYTPEAIQERIGQPVKRPRRRAVPLQKNGRVNLLLDIQSRLQGRGPGYERWLKIHNLKEAAKTLNYLTEHNITDYELPHLFKRHQNNTMVCFRSYTVSIFISIRISTESEYQRTHKSTSLV